MMVNLNKSNNFQKSLIDPSRFNILDSSFYVLFGFYPTDYILKLNYSSRFKPYNGNVRYYKNTYEFNLSSLWKNVSNDIRVGIIQHLMLKAFDFPSKTKLTLNIEMYNKFIKELNKYSSASVEDSILLDSFNRVNDRYFNGLMETTSIKWGVDSIRTLGHYSYASDLITISSIFRDPSATEFLDFIMYHELLHKKHKFVSSATGRNLHHSSKFRIDEKKYSDYVNMEKRLRKFVSKKRK